MISKDLEHYNRL